MVRATSGPHDIIAMRRAAHNAIAYQRRRYRPWKQFGVWGWYVGGDFHGIVELGSISTTEFLHTFRRRGEVGLRPIEIKNLRAEVYAAAMSVSATATATAAGKGRYQPLKVAIEPVMIKKRPVPVIDDMMIEAMPVLV